MPQTGAAGFRRSDRHGDSLAPPIVGFDPVGEIFAYDNRASSAEPQRDERVGRSAEESASAAENTQPESRAAARAAMAEAFAAQFGVDDESPSAAALADRFGFRFEDSANGSVGRRTVTITGHGAERSVPPAERSGRRGGGEPRRRAGRPDPLMGLYADRAALWAVGLAIVLALVAAMSAHALPLH
jgi:pyruvate/2-oxoglutarate dehydrogenase complex dihydrolipoamide acyltransferase (E2) component